LPAQPRLNSFLRPVGNRICLILKRAASSYPVESRFLQRGADRLKHQLRWMIDSSAKIYGDTSKVRHLQCDWSIESRIDLGSCNVDRDPETRPTAPSFDESHQVRGNQNSFQGLSEHELSGMETEDILLEVMPEVGRRPEGRIDVNRRKIVRGLLEGRELPPQTEINANLPNLVRGDRRVNFELAFRKIAKEVRFGEDQRAEPSKPVLRTSWTSRRYQGGGPGTFHPAPRPRKREPTSVPR
jgi:hypothetical protein